MDPLVQMRTSYSSLSESERRVASYVLKNPGDIVLMSLQMLALNCGTSEATVLRFARSLGYSGYSDFKAALVPALIRQGAPVHKQLGSADPLSALSDKLLTNISRALRDTFEALDSSVVEMAADRIARSNIVATIGLAGSGAVGRILADSLLGIGKVCVNLSDHAELGRMVGCMTDSDVVIGISHSGDSEEVALGLKRAKTRGLFTLALTNYSPSEVAKVADAVLLTVVPESLLGSYSCFPRIAELGILEILVHRVASRLKQ